MISKLVVDIMNLSLLLYTCCYTRMGGETGIDFTESQMPPSVEISWIPGQ